MTAEPAHFDLSGVSLRYNGQLALSDVDLRIAAGEAVAFVGPSGAGKTSLLHLLNGTRRASAGHIAVSGRELDRLSRAELATLRSRIGFVHQNLSLVPNLRASQNVLAGRVGREGLFTSLRNLLWPRRAALAEVHRLLERVGIADKLFERTDRLSGGQRQRVAIARALYQEPSALLADEPVSSVDPARARDTIELLTQISREESLTLCVSLHSLELAREYFARLVGLRDGRIVFDRPSEQVGEDELQALFTLHPVPSASQDSGLRTKPHARGLAGPHTERDEGG